MKTLSPNIHRALDERDNLRARNYQLDRRNRSAFADLARMSSMIDELKEENKKLRNNQRLADLKREELLRYIDDLESSKPIEA